MSTADRCASCGAWLAGNAMRQRIDFGDGQDPFEACRTCADTARHCAGVTIIRYEIEDGCP